MLTTRCARDRWRFPGAVQWRADAALLALTRGDRVRAKRDIAVHGAPVLTGGEPATQSRWAPAGAARGDVSHPHAAGRRKGPAAAVGDSHRRDHQMRSISVPVPRPPAQHMVTRPTPASW